MSQPAAGCEFASHSPTVKPAPSIPSSRSTRRASPSIKGATMACGIRSLVHEIRIDNDPPAATTLPPPSNVRALGYDRHVEIEWDPVEPSALARYVIYRSIDGDGDGDGNNFSPVGMQLPGIFRYEDFLGKPDVHAQYKVTASDWQYRQSAFSNVASAYPRVERRRTAHHAAAGCFHYYWEGADPHSGMARENIPEDDRIVATGASGFGIMALMVGVDRGFITRQQGVERLTKIVIFSNMPRGTTARGRTSWTAILARRWPCLACSKTAETWSRRRFSWKACSQYGSTSTDPARMNSLSIAGSRNFGKRSSGTGIAETPTSEFLYWHWSPQWSWQIHHPLIGFNEVMIAYLLGIASPTHAVPATLYYSGWVGQSQRAIAYREGWSGSTEGDHYGNGHTYFGIKVDVGVGTGGPLFSHTTRSWVSIPTAFMMASRNLISKTIAISL